MRTAVGLASVSLLLLPLWGCDTEQPIQLPTQEFSFFVRSGSVTTERWGVYYNLFDCTDCLPVDCPDLNGDGRPDFPLSGPETKCVPLHNDPPPGLEFPRCEPIQGTTAGGNIPWFFKADVRIIRAGTTEEVPLARDEFFTSLAPYNDASSLGTPEIQRVTVPELDPSGARTYYVRSGGIQSQSLSTGNRFILTECFPDFASDPPLQEELLHTPNLLQPDCCPDFDACSQAERDACQTVSVPLRSGDTVVVRILKQEADDSPFVDFTTQRFLFKSIPLDPDAISLNVRAFLDGLPVDSSLQGDTTTDTRDGSGMTFSFTMQ